jgi:hypothetical protein
MSSSRESIMLREGVLGCNNAALLTLTAFKTCLAMCDFEYYKKFWLLSPDTNWFSDDGQRLDPKLFLPSFPLLG